ncbi:MAG: PAS domain S-box protein [Nitrospirae bacterium]|nr:PAS domain S-box protein [Nitrospirota bacterium]
MQTENSLSLWSVVKNSRISLALWAILVLLMFWYEVYSCGEKAHESIFLVYWIVGAVFIVIHTRREMKKNIDLIRSEDKFRILFERSMDAVLLLDEDKFVECNPAALSMMHCTKPELLVAHPWELSPPEQPDGRPSSEKAIEMIDIAHERGGHRFEWIHRRMDGKDFPVEVTLVPIPLDHGRKVLFTTWRDITERKKAEEALKHREEMYRNLSSQFNALLDAIPDSISLISPDYKVLWANRTAAERVGRKPDDIEGQSCYGLWFNEKAPCEECPIRDSIQSGKLSERHVVRNNRRFDVRAVPALGADGVVNVIRVARDVTEHSKLEDQLRQSQKMESVGTLAGGIAHDFNNIITAIIGYGYMVQKKLKDDPATQEFVEEIIDGATRAAELTRGLLTFSRKQLINLQYHNLNCIVSNMEKMLRRIIGEDIAFETVIGDKDIMVRIDAAQIDQLLMNLATNARDAMPNGGHLIIKAEVVAIDSSYAEAHLFAGVGDYALLAVSDTGIGMDAETRERIFEPFFTTKEVGKGTGLGLAMAYGIIKQHNGNIHVYSEPGIGTTFKIYLPMAPLEKQESATKHVSYAPKGRGETILIAEDDSHVRSVVSLYLKQAGYNTIEVENGEEAISKFKENAEKVAVLVLDVIMPVKNGRAATDEIKKIKPDIKVIYMSGYTDDIITKKGMLEDGFDFISKPINSEIMLTKIREVLDRP